MNNINVISLLLIIFFVFCEANKINSNLSSVNLEIYGRNVGTIQNELLSEFEDELNNKRIYKTDRKVPIIGNVFNHFNKWINRTYGENKLKTLFENKNNTQKDIINRLDQWWGAYTTDKFKTIIINYENEKYFVSYIFYYIKLW